MDLLTSPTTFPLPEPVLILEDDAHIQQRLVNILVQLGYQQSQLYLASSLAQVYALTDQQMFALALVDLGLPDGNGGEFIARLRQQDSKVGILVISAFSGEEAIIHALKAGATGYLLKERDDVEVSFSIRNMLRGGTPIDPFIARRLLLEFDQACPAHANEEATQLSEREIEILTLVADGLSNRKISEKLTISHHTVGTHIKRIYNKLAVCSRVQAVLEAQMRGLLD